MEFPYFLVIVAICVSFYASFMGGANDFANAFGTSVGSGANTIRQAVLIAIIAELIGAVLVGAHVTDTVRKGIVDTSGFIEHPEILLYGLLAALIGSGLFLQLATYWGLPVSTTHSIVGAMIGFGLVASGFDSVQWGSVGNIAMSWVISPIGGGVVAYLTFRIIQKKVLETAKPIASSAKLVPYFVGITVMVLTLSMIYKGLKNLKLELTFPEALGYGAIAGVLAGLVVWLKMRDLRCDDPRDEQLDRVEGIFKYLQIFTAGYVAFAHGSNDVANSVGPLAGIWAIYHDGMVDMKAQVPIWILVMGGTGIVLGLAVFGKRVIETVGTKITHVTPSRGFAAEFAAATVVLTFSKLGMPVSTTHTLVGAVIGVGLARGIGAIDLRVVQKIFMSWIVTIPLAAIGTVIAYLILRAIF
ncbi:MAG: inorganic phosphate transporter [Candidatus Electryoneaceae bacterium]|nr:inorganic phosphate transporter [Candidatus Electryoneaceae bacterium]